MARHAGRRGFDCDLSRILSARYGKSCQGAVSQTDKEPLAERPRLLTKLFGAIALDPAKPGLSTK
ncbi:hypothetical protein DBR44_12870 [Aquitalea sp. FJL05]|nr:hypothetical protein DBR44_12870 [Aquitalea sp. FJL05]